MWNGSTSAPFEVRSWRSAIANRKRVRGAGSSPLRWRRPTGDAAPQVPPHLRGRCPYDLRPTQPRARDRPAGPLWERPVRSGLKPGQRARHARPQLALAGGVVDRFALVAEDDVSGAAQAASWHPSGNDRAARAAQCDGRRAASGPRRRRTAADPGRGPHCGSTRFSSRTSEEAASPRRSSAPGPQSSRTVRSPPETTYDEHAPSSGAAPARPRTSKRRLTAEVWRTPQPTGPARPSATLALRARCERGTLEALTDRQRVERYWFGARSQCAGRRARAV